jgi:cellulose synthase/poly-beta-1,6-N-acetylglucosamine synthase-like glycosyltransferase
LAVSVLFTGILFERSFKWKGILAGLLYSAIAVVVLILPLLLHEFVLNNFFYPIELFVLEIVMGLLVFAASIWVSGFLLKKKVTV